MGGFRGAAALEPERLAAIMGAVKTCCLELETKQPDVILLALYHYDAPGNSQAITDLDLDLCTVSKDNDSLSSCLAGGRCGACTWAVACLRELLRSWEE